MSDNVIIIGGGGSLLQKENGSKIDAFDYVVRMGSCKIHGYEKYVGTKTDMFRVAWKNHFCQVDNTVYYVDTELRGFSDVLLTEARDFDNYNEITTVLNKTSHYSNHVYKDVCGGAVVFSKGQIQQYKKSRMLFEMCLLWFVKKHSSIKNVFFYSIKDRVNLITSLQKLRHGVLPSHGLYTIDYIIKARPNDNIFIAGFDGFKYDYYWRDHVTFHGNHCGVTEQMYIRKMIKKGRLNVL